MNSAPEVLEIRGLARDFATAELRPHTEAWDAHGGFDETIVTKLAELGFFGMLLPEDAGGMGFDLATFTAAIEELAWGEAGVAMLVLESSLAAQLLAGSGEAATRDAWLPRLASGDATACFVDNADVRIDNGRITGAARFVLNGARAAVAIVATPTGTYAVARDGGFTSSASATPLGLRTLGMHDLTFTGAAAQLGDTTGHTRTALVSTAAVAVGISQAALEHAVRYAGEREQFGQALRRFEGIQHKLAEMATRTAAARVLLQHAAGEAADDTAAAMAKLSAGTCAMFVTTEAVQVFGGYGYMRDYPVEKLMRDAKAMELLHGTSEAQRMRIAESLYS